MIAVVKAFSWTLAKKSNAPSCFNTDNGPRNEHQQSQINQTPVSVPDEQPNPSPHQPTEKSASSLSNQFVSSGIIPANLLDLFMILVIKQKKTTTARVAINSRVLTSDEHLAMYEEKIRKITRAGEAKKNERRQGSRGRQGKKSRRRIK